MEALVGSKSYFCLPMTCDTDESSSRVACRFTTTYPHEHRIIYCCHIIEQDDLGGLRLLSSSLASWRFPFADALKLRVLSRANCDCVTIKLEFKKFGVR